jgi:hypothetical protein
LEEEKERLRGYPDDQQESASRDSEHDERSTTLTGDSMGTVYRSPTVAEDR